MTRFACVLAMVLGGCTLYWPDGDHKVVCNGGYGLDDQPTELFRDPYTGQCETQGYTGGGTCGELCGPCPEPATGGAIAENWSSCATACAGLTEASCRLTGGCQAQYLDSGGATATFWDCEAVEPGPPPPAGTDCGKLDAYTCAQDDACVIVYAGGTTDNATKFESCSPELMPEPPPPPPPPPACDTLTTEADCTARGDCDAVYDGYDCVCDLSGCVCKTEVFASCQAR